MNIGRWRGEPAFPGEHSLLCRGRLAWEYGSHWHGSARARKAGGGLPVAAKKGRAKSYETSRLIWWDQRANVSHWPTDELRMQADRDSGAGLRMQ